MRISLSNFRVTKGWDYEIFENAIKSNAITTGTLVFSNINKTKELIEFAKNLILFLKKVFIYLILNNKVCFGLMVHLQHIMFLQF